VVEVPLSLADLGRDWEKERGERKVREGEKC